MFEDLGYSLYYHAITNTILGCNFILIFYGFFQVYKYRTEKDKYFLIRSFIAFGSPLICSLYIFFVSSFFKNLIISLLGYYLWQAYPLDIRMISGMCTALSLAMLAFNQPMWSKKFSELISPAKTGIVGGLSIFGILLFTATIIYVRTALFFGKDYIQLGWTFFYYPTLSSMSLQSKLWAYGFFMFFTDFFYVGLLTPFLWILNGMSWTNGKKIFALLLTIHLAMFYSELPWILAMIIVGP